MLSALEESLGPERVKEVLEGKRQVVASCGSGMTAGVIWLGLKLLGVERIGLYDEVSVSVLMEKIARLNGFISLGPVTQCDLRARLLRESRRLRI